MDEDNKNSGRRRPAHFDALSKVYMREINDIELLSREEEAKLAVQIHCHNRHQSEEARAKFIKANLRLVVKISYDYLGRGISEHDLISEGNIGLMTAVEKYNPDKGARFSTYATWWIRQAMQKAIANNSRMIRIPVQSAERLNKIRHTHRQLSEELGRDPTDLEIADHLDFSERTVSGLRLVDSRTLSLNDPVANADEHSEYQDIIADSEASTPCMILEDIESNEHLRDIIESLDDPRERQIIKMRFGMDGNPPLTLDEISKSVGRTRERVRQIINKILMKIKTRYKEDPPSFSS
jgi:RNA polymerase primary sigma factor